MYELPQTGLSTAVRGLSCAGCGKAEHCFIMLIKMKLIDFSDNYLECLVIIILKSWTSIGSEFWVLQSSLVVWQTHPPHLLGKTPCRSYI